MMLMMMMIKILWENENLRPTSLYTIRSQLEEFNRSTMEVLHPQILSNSAALRICLCLVSRLLITKRLVKPLSALTRSEQTNQIRQVRSNTELYEGPNLRVQNLPNHPLHWIN